MAPHELHKPPVRSMRRRLGTAAASAATAGSSSTRRSSTASCADSVATDRWPSTRAPRPSSSPTTTTKKEQSASSANAAMAAQCGAVITSGLRGARSVRVRADFCLGRVRARACARACVCACTRDPRVRVRSSVRLSLGMAMPFDARRAVLRGNRALSAHARSA
eukprot:2132652-Pleurochrysis_carterae.AAC.1